MQPDFGADFAGKSVEKSSFDALRDMLDRGRHGQSVSLEEAEALLGITLLPEERAKYEARLEEVLRELTKLIGEGVCTEEMLRRHGAYLYPQLPRVALQGDAVAVTLVTLRERFGMEYQPDPAKLNVAYSKIPTFGAMHPGLPARLLMDAETSSHIEPAWVLAFTKPFGGRRSNDLHVVEGDLKKMNGDVKGRFEVARMQSAVYGALMEALKPIGSAKRNDDMETRRLTRSGLRDGKQILVRRPVDKHTKPLVEMENGRPAEFRERDGFFIAWEFPVEL